MSFLQRLTFILLFACLNIFSTNLNAAGLRYVETADGKQSSKVRELVQWTHSRLVFDKDLKRVAVGQNKTMEVEILGGKELLVLAKQVGRTSLIVWYADNSTETFLFSITEDLQVLRSALRDINRNIYIKLAPDRKALVLRGKVPTVKHRVAAENAARHYLNAGKEQSSSNALLMQSSAFVQKGSNDDKFRLAKNKTVNIRGGAAIINLIQVDELPVATVEKITNAIKSVGGENVIIERIMHGDVEDDEADTLILKGKVRNQVALVRVLNIASRLFLGSQSKMDSKNAISVIADESGALLNKIKSGSNTSGGLNFGGVSGRASKNNINSNIARAKLLSVSGGRILSMLDVEDVPQVRISVQLYEVNRKKLRSWRPDMSMVTNGFSNSGQYGGNNSSNVSLPFTSKGTQVENALKILGGTLSNTLQIGTTNYAFDLLFSLLENEGISRTLSRPTLTVLAGEDAIFQVGGEVPVPKAFAPTGVVSGDSVGTNTSGVFSGTEFRAFGVQLKVKAMVDEQDLITLDVNPTVSVPDSLLTKEIASSTGTSLNSTAFNVRSIDTTTRLQDGQPMVIGGLVSRDISDDQRYTPGIRDIPVLGNLAESYNKSDNDRELIIIVTPTLIREPVNEARLWQYPKAKMYLNKLVNK